MLGIISKLFGGSKGEKGREENPVCCSEVKASVDQAFHCSQVTTNYVIKAGIPPAHQRHLSEIDGRIVARNQGSRVLLVEDINGRDAIYKRKWMR